MVATKFPDDLERSDFEREKIPPNDMHKGEDSKGSMDHQKEEDKIANSLVDDDGSSLDDATLVNDALNQGMGNFSPNLMFEKMVRNYRSAKNIFGESMIRATSGYDPEYVEKNIKYPEFKRELEKRMKDKQDEFEKKKLIDKKGDFSNKALALASITMYTQELDQMNTTHDLYGEKANKEKDKYGEKQDFQPFKKGLRFRDIALKKSIRQSLRRNSSALRVDDLKAFERESKGTLNLIYAIDSSSSMKGKKLEAGKRAGIALAYRAIMNKDKVGVIAFAQDVLASVEPCSDFVRLARSLTGLQPKDETDFKKLIDEAIKLFPSGNEQKHLVILTDAMPTAGDNPVENTLEAVSMAKGCNITISIVGINLEKEGEELAKKITLIGEGRLFAIGNTENLNQIVLQDYYAS